MTMYMHFGFQAHGLPTAHYYLDYEAPIIIIEFRSQVTQVTKELLRTMSLSDLQ